MALQQRSLELLAADIRQWIRSGQNDVAGLSPEHFLKSELASQAGSLCIVCVGEATGKLSKGYTDFPNDMLRKELTFANDTRNRIANGYYELDADKLRDTQTVSFPGLSTALDATLQEKPL